MPALVPEDWRKRWLRIGAPRRAWSMMTEEHSPQGIAPKASGNRNRSTRKARVTQTQITRAVKGAMAAGLPVARVELTPDGGLAIFAGAPDRNVGEGPPPASKESAFEPWD